MNLKKSPVRFLNVLFGTFKIRKFINWAKLFSCYFPVNILIKNFRCKYWRKSNKFILQITNTGCSTVCTDQIQGIAQSAQTTYQPLMFSGKCSLCWHKNFQHFVTYSHKYSYEWKRADILNTLLISHVNFHVQRYSTILFIKCL